MPLISDLVRDSKLETRFYPGYTQHVYYVSGATLRQRKVRKEERWERGRNLGAGAFGIVWLEKFVTENAEVKHRAVKEIRKTVQRPKAADYSRELEAIAKFSHSKYELCFVKSFGWYENCESVFITMEYFPLGDLQNYLSSPLPEEEAQQITSQVLEGLAFMHENGFAHRDLKPNNILVKSKGPDWWIKIGDFGISKRAEEGLTALRTLNGTPGFLAPEMLMQLGLFDDDDFEVSDEYTVAVDIWSLGEIAFRALTGVSPFPIKSLRTYVKGTSGFPVQLLQAHSISNEGCDFLKKLMAPMPQTRLSAKDALTHVWIEPKPSSARASAEIQRSNSTRQEEISPDQLITEASACWSTADVPALEADIFVSPASKQYIVANPQTMQRAISNFADTNPKLGEETLQNGSASTHTSDQAQAKNDNQGEFYTIAEALARPGTSERFTSPISSRISAYKQTLRTTIQQKDLQSFYPLGSPILDQIANRAATQVDDSCTKWGLPKEVANDIISLGLFDIWLYIDDSASMQYEEEGKRISDLQVILESVTYTATLFNNNGINIRFMNSRPPLNYCDGVRSKQQIDQLMSQVQFKGHTPMGTKLKEEVLNTILDQARANQLRKPVLVITITDGQPTNEPANKVFEVIKTASTELSRTQYGAGAINFQFARVGNDEKAREFLSQMDLDPMVGNLVDCTSSTFHNISECWE